MGYFTLDCCSESRRAHAPRVGLLAIVLLYTNCIFGQTIVQTDGTVGVQTTLSGSQVVVPETLGTRSGNNLFHSFSQFTIESDSSTNTFGSVTFTGGPDIDNVISRVTGDASSVINGSLISRVGEADFFFINPNGIVFGEEARVNVPGAFYTAVASSIQFADGANFGTDDISGGSLLSVADPVAFGFLGVETNSLSLSGSAIRPAEGLSVTLVAPDLALTGNDGQQLSIDLIGADLTLVSTGESFIGEVSLTPTEPLDYQGNILLENAVLETSDGGDIFIAGGEIVVRDQSRVGVVNRGDRAVVGGEIFLSARNLTISNASNVFSDTVGQGAAGRLVVNVTDELLIDGSGSTQLASGIQSDSNGVGNAGSVDVAANTVVILSGGNIRSIASAEGDGGSVVLVAHNVLIDGTGQNSETGVYASSNGTNLSGERPAGSAGRTSIRADGLTVLSGGIVGTSSLSGQGNAGEVQVRIDGRILLDAGDSEFVTGIVSDSVTPDQAGGVVIVEARNIQISNGAQISARSASIDSPGRLELTANESIELSAGSSISTEAAQNNAGTISVISDRLLLLDSRMTTSSAGAGGEGGDIALDSRYLILDGGFIQANAGGVGGNVDIQADSVIASAAGLELNQNDLVFFSLDGPNVIQAVGSVEGSVNLLTPEIDLSAAIVELESRVFQSVDLVSSPCDAFVDGAPSSLVYGGKGSVPVGDMHLTGLARSGVMRLRSYVSTQKDAAGC